MIKKMILKNFQIHKKLILEFDEKLNIIQGANDSGKSSIIRALFWTFYNSPSGDWMCRIDKNGKMKTCTVKIVFSDGTAIKRTRGEKINRYSVNEQDFDNFGYDVPDEVKRAIGIFPFKTFKEEFNPHVSMQDERGFLIHESSPTKASVLDTLTGVSVLRRGIKSFNSEQQDLKRDLSSLDEENKKLEKDLLKLESVELISTEIENERRKDEEISLLKEKLKELSRIRNKVCEVRKFLSGKEKISGLESKIKKCLELFSSLKENEKKKSSLDHICTIVNRNKKRIIDIPLLTDSLSLASLIKELSNRISELQGFRDSLEQKKRKIKENDSELAETKDRFNRLKKEIGICPLCEGVGKWTQ